MIQDPFFLHLAAKYKTPAFTDAVGTGCIFGGILACAVALPYEYYNPEVDDSKKLPHDAIYRLAPLLKIKMAWAIGMTSPEELLAVQNNLKGEHIAMTRAVSALKRKISIDAVFVDGKFTLPKTELPSYGVIKGDTKIFGIAAASIIAKNERDHIVMDVYGDEYARYHIRKNKGYRSPDHLMALRKFGAVHPFHRTYLPQVKRVLSGEYDSVILTKYKDRWEKLCACNA